MRSAVSRQKQLSVVFGIANAQKQGVMGVRPALASSTTMFQELVQSEKHNTLYNKNVVLQEDKSE